MIERKDLDERQDMMIGVLDDFSKKQDKVLLEMELRKEREIRA